VEILGIDVGGSGIKGAPVSIETGAMLAPRHRIPTPQPAKPRQVAEVVAELVRHFDWHGPVGCGFPAAVRGGIVLTASNIHDKFIGTNAAELFSEASGCPVCMVNDADAAGLAEMTYGAGRGRKGVVFMVTIGTGLGTALFTDGKLLPNAELGHIEINGVKAELRASDAARKRENLSWEKWGKRFNEYLSTLEALFWPDLFILGGGVSKDYEKFAPMIKLQTEVVLAQFLNEAGIVGAALSARSCVVDESGATS
jgi:polyphosphate glucokinase